MINEPVEGKIEQTVVNHNCVANLVVLHMHYQMLSQKFDLKHNRYFHSFVKVEKNVMDLNMEVVEVDMVVVVDILEVYNINNYFKINNFKYFFIFKKNYF